MFQDVAGNTIQVTELYFENYCVFNRNIMAGQLYGHYQSASASQQNLNAEEPPSITGYAIHWQDGDGNTIGITVGGNGTRVEVKNSWEPGDPGRVVKLLATPTTSLFCNGRIPRVSECKQFCDMERFWIPAKAGMTEIKLSQVWQLNLTTPSTSFTDICPLAPAVFDHYTNFVCSFTEEC